MTYSTYTSSLFHYAILGFLFQHSPFHTVYRCFHLKVLLYCTVQLIRSPTKRHRRVRWYRPFFDFRPAPARFEYLRGTVNVQERRYLILLRNCVSCLLHRLDCYLLAATSRPNTGKMTELTSSSPEVSSTMLPYPYSLSPLPEDLKRGLIAPGTTGILSAACCIAMLLFVIYRFLTWRSHYKTFVGYNQYVVLIINLLLADMMQGVSFMFSFHWISHDGIFAPSQTCFSQGFLLNLGDLANGFFVFGIALHTFYGAVKSSHVKHTTFTIYVIVAWLFALFLSSLGPIMHRGDYFVRAGAWCWASSKYESERLALHYIWIFLVQFGTIILYALIFLHLKRVMLRILPASQSTTHAKVDRAAKLMVLFPIAYIFLTLPLSAGRMWTRAHGGENLPTGYALAAGSMIGSCGMVDCLLYTLTRRSLLRQNIQGTSNSRDEVEKQEKSLHMKDFNISGITQTRTITVTGGRLSTISNDDGSSTHSLTHPSTHTGHEKTSYPSSNGYDTSEIGGQDRIITPGINGLDPRKGGRRVEITATATVVEIESSEDGDCPTSEEVEMIRRAGSPYSMRQALGLFRGASTQL